MKDLTGRVAVVTGGASGIGLGLAKRFVAEGMKVVLGDVEKDALDDAVAVLSSGGSDVCGVVTDVTDADQVQSLADATMERHGAVHVICNNAGVGGGGLSWEAPLSTWEWVIGVNMWGVIHGIRSFVPLLLQQDEGHVVNTASVAGLVAAPFMGPYNASKHAVVGMSETLHHEFALTGANVKVSVLCPGWVNTRIADSARNRPSHLAVEQASDDAAQETVMRDMLQTMVQQGMATDTVASKVVDAIRNEQFWVLTHDDAGDGWVKAVEARLTSLQERTNPAMNLLA
ncbi:MAG: short-chain alcohol dehydrogenase [Actinomycetia bacterium]|nr:short-chain alcohol dehydrogenase [Actinomycetes bacterium]